MGGNDLLIATTGNDTLYAGQFGHLGNTTPTAAVVTDSALKGLYNNGTPAPSLADLTATVLVAGTGIVNMVGSDAGNDYFLIGKANNTIYGSGLGANGTTIDVNDQDTLSFNQIGTTYYKGYRDLTITVNFVDLNHQTGSVVGTYTSSSGSIATLFVDKFFDIEHFVFGTTRTIFKNPDGTNYYPGPIDPGYTGGDPGVVNASSGLIDPGPATSTVTGNNPAGGNTVNGGGGGNTNFNGGGGPTPNTLNFSSTSGGTFYDCTDTGGKTGSVRNYSLVIDLGNQRYSYQQDINGTPTVYGGSVSNFQNVTGTVDCSDVLVGKSDTLSLVGGGGQHNIVFGGGGGIGASGAAMFGSRAAAAGVTSVSAWGVANVTANAAPTTQSNGGDGDNWAVFQNPVDLINGGVGYSNGTQPFSGTNAGSGRADDVYGSVGINANLTSGTYTDRALNGRSGDMVGFANLLGSAGADLLIGDKYDNILVGGGGNDTMAGGSDGGDGGNWGGYNTLYGGSGTNQIMGGALSGNTDTFVVGYDYNPVAAGAYASDGTYGPTTPALTINGNKTGEIKATIPGGSATVGIVTTTTAAAEDHIADWKNSDHLYVSTSGTAIVEGLNESDSASRAIFNLAGQGPTEGRTIDFSGAQNLGQIRVTVGDGNNTVTGSTTAYLDGIVPKGGNDFIKMGNGNNTILSGNGNDVVVVGNGNNTITVGTGVGKKIYTGGGYNTVNLGLGDDTVYISKLSTKDDIHHFTSGTDKIYLDRTMLNAAGITDLVQRQIDPITYSDYAATIEAGQDYKSGVFIGAPLFNAVYRSALQTSFYGISDGASKNSAHYSAYTAGISAEVGLQIGLFATGYALYPIPFVGPILGAVFVALGLGVIADQVTARQHLNPVYNTDPLNTIPGEDDNMVTIDGVQKQADNPIIGFSNVMSTNVTPGQAFGANWVSTPFMSFYNYSTAGGFVPSLEVIWNKQQGSGGINKTWSTQDAGSTSVAGDPVLANGVSGIKTVALLHSEGQTFIYLINSPDALIQSNEAKLIARVDGVVKASDLGLFDTSTDENLHSENTFTPPPGIQGLTYTTSASGKTITSNLSGDMAATSATSATVIVQFQALLSTNDVVRLLDSNGVLVDEKSGFDGRTVSFDLSSLTEGGNGYSITVTGPDGLDNSKSFSVVVDSIAPTNTATIGTLGHSDYVPAKNPVGLTASVTGIVVSANESASFALYDSGNSLVSLDTSPSSKSVSTSYVPLDKDALNATIVPTAQTFSTWLESIHFEDLAGNTSTVLLGVQPDGLTQLPYIGLGTTGSDTFTVGYGSNAVIYGFGGSDLVTANSNSSSLTTFIGGTNTPNVISANANGGNMYIDLTGSQNHADTVSIADGAATVHAASVGADASVAMLIMGFHNGDDELKFSSDGIASAPVTSVFHDGTGTPLTPVTHTVAHGLTLAESNGVFAIGGTYTGSALLSDLIAGVESIIASTAGSVAAFNYQYSTSVDVYDLDATSPTYGTVIGSVPTPHNDLIVVHADSGGTYSVVQLVGAGLVPSLSVDPTTHAIFIGSVV